MNDSIPNDFLQQRLGALLGTSPRRALSDELPEVLGIPAAAAPLSPVGGSRISDFAIDDAAYRAALYGINQQTETPLYETPQYASSQHERPQYAPSQPGTSQHETRAMSKVAQLTAVNQSAIAEPRPSVTKRVWDFTRSHVAAVGTILLAGCLWAGYSISQAQSTQIPAPVVVSDFATPSATEAARDATGGTGKTAEASSVSESAIEQDPAETAAVAAVDKKDSSAKTKVFVHVLGEVESPGVVEVKSGDRITDALLAAGGLTANADPAELNFAETVIDGSQIIIGTRKKPLGEIKLPAAAPAGDASTSTTTASAGKVSLNQASAEQLQTLPGVGPVTAQKIISWRQAHGGFKNISELQEVSGIGSKTYAELAPNVQL